MIGVVILRSGASRTAHGTCSSRTVKSQGPGGSVVNSIEGNCQVSVFEVWGYISECATCAMVGDRHRSLLL